MTGAGGVTVVIASSFRSQYLDRAPISERLARGIGAMALDAKACTRITWHGPLWRERRSCIASLAVADGSWQLLDSSGVQLLVLEASSWAEPSYSA